MDGTPLTRQSDKELAEFIASTFPSVWSIELLALLAGDPARAWSIPELVAALRASEMVVNQCSEKLIAAGLVMPMAKGRARYQPASPALAEQARASLEYYRRRPNAVRRLIVSRVHSGVQAFADAFIVRKG